MSTDYWTAQDCADHWGISPITWRSYVSRGQAPAPSTRISRTPLWDPATVRAWPRPGRGKTRHGTPRRN